MARSRKYGEAGIREKQEVKIIKKCRKAKSGDKQGRGEKQEVKRIRKWENRKWQEAGSGEKEEVE